MTPLEIESLVSLARMTMHCIVEIGTQYGHTCVELAKAFPFRTVISIDNSGPPTMCDGQRSEQLSPEKIGHLTRGRPNVLLADCDSSQFVFATLKIGFVLIDGDHSYAGVKRDTEHFLQYFRSHSSEGQKRFIAWHDASPNKPEWVKVLDYLRTEISPRPWKQIEGTELAYLGV